MNAVTMSSTQTAARPLEGKFGIVTGGSRGKLLLLHISAIPTP